MSMTGNIVRRMIAPLAQRLRLMVSRGVVKVVNDALKCQGLQVELLSDELQDDVERFQEYGFTSTPFTDAEALFLSVGGNRSHGVVVCVTDRRYRPLSLNAGDVCLYTDNGERVYLDRDNDIVNIGAKAAADFLATKSDIDDLQSAIDGWVPVPNDGGAALKTALAAWLAATLGTTKVKAT